jgi:hypothetical protein
MIFLSQTESTPKHFFRKKALQKSNLKQVFQPHVVQMPTLED